MLIKFPPVENASEEGLLAVGGNLEPIILESAYRQGVFPWPLSADDPMTWFAPDPRGIIDFNQFKVPKSFKRFLNNNPFQAKFNTDFELVIEHCSKVPRKGEKGTWITNELKNAYTELFHLNKVFCVSIYRDERLVGGLYGVCFGEIISGESMFHLESNASKFAIYSLVDHLSKLGISWIDTQMVTPIVEQFGGQLISRNIFMTKLKQLNSSRLWSKNFSDDLGPLGR